MANLLTKKLYKNRQIIDLCQRSLSAKAVEALKESKYESVVGLEVHAQINSKSKLFSGASCDGFYKAPNSSVSYFDAAVPGTLPRLNKRCVEAGVKTALALSCHINNISMFDRKHYFYADSPAGYQITQQRLPLAVNGQMSFPVMIQNKEPYYKTVRLHQLQLEQDSGKSLHFPEFKRSLIDLNRAGAPLMELVFEPDLQDGEEAAALVKELVLILQMIDTCSCKWHEGGIRVDANISINRKGEPLGVRTEVKNISSPRAIARAVKYEIDRQIELVEDGGIVTNETRQWDAEARQTVRMRDKEVQQDYRFMPEPNLLPLNLDTVKGFSVDETKEKLPKLPDEIRQKLISDFDMKPTTAAILVQNDKFRPAFFHIIKNYPIEVGKALANFLTADIVAGLNRLKLNSEECPLNIEQIEELFHLQQNRLITKATAQHVLDIILEDTAQSSIDIVNQNNWKQIHDAEIIRKFCEEAVGKYPKLVKLFKKGKETGLRNAIQRAANQQVNAVIMTEILRKMLK